jgi:hypothetical protein
VGLDLTQLSKRASDRAGAIVWSDEVARSNSSRNTSLVASVLDGELIFFLLEILAMRFEGTEITEPLHWSR